MLHWIVRLPARLLLYGKNSTLLSTRVMLLEAIHLHASTAVHFEVFQQMLLDEPFALLVLCHSLWPVEREDAVAKARALRPELKILVLTALAPTRRVLDGHELSVFHGPETFLATVRWMLGSETGRLYPAARTGAAS